MNVTTSIGPTTLLATVLWACQALGNDTQAGSYQRMAEWTVESRKGYADPFNDVDVEVVFSTNGQTWRVPTFWRGGNRWTVRFAPPAPGTYHYHLESTDKTNPDLNGHAGEVSVSAYSGPSALLRHGAIRVSANRRYFEQADGTPFFWLGDTWWTNLSDRLSWEGFKALTADRKDKGFTVVQIVAGLVPSNEEVAPTDPGFCNEGGCVWDAEFKRINPRYFDFADRRIQHLLDHGLVPAIVGAWRDALAQMGAGKMRQHWRYLIARYGAYPVFWVAGGEVIDSPEYPTGWTDIVRFIRHIDPYHHPLTSHEAPPKYDSPVLDESLTDFDFFQPGHGSWPTVATEIALLNKHYARTTITKPLVIGEIGYEGHQGEHDATFQRAAFWLALLNGAAGFTYGTIETAEAYSTEKPVQRVRWSFQTWEEAMHRPGSRQVGLGARQLQQFKWWHLTPHPEWVIPRGTTLLEPNNQISGFDIDRLAVLQSETPPLDEQLPAGEWSQRHGNFRLPYAAGIPDQLRLIYLPYWGTNDRPIVTPTILGLEEGIQYQAYYWDPALAIHIDLGHIGRPAPGALIYETRPDQATPWKALPQSATIKVIAGVEIQDGVAAVDIDGQNDVALVLRGRDAGNYFAAVYSAREGSIYIRETRDAVDGPKLGITAIPDLQGRIQLSAEIREAFAAVSVNDGIHHYTSPIVEVKTVAAGHIGLFVAADAPFPKFDRFEVRQSPQLPKDEHLQRRLYDYRGTFRGEFDVPGIPAMEKAGFPAWDSFGKQKLILLDAYRPPPVPFRQDWLLVLKAESSRSPKIQD